MLIIFFNSIISFLKRCLLHIEWKCCVKSLGFFDKTAVFLPPLVCTCPQKIFLYENANVYYGSKFIINPKGDNGRFIMKKNSGSAEGLTVITGNHQRQIGLTFKQSLEGHKFDIDKDVIVEEDVWIGANVTLLSGVTIGRGATVGAGSVCVKNVPPYAIVLGNPAKVVGFNFTPEEIIIHEMSLFQEKDRLPLDTLQANYEKYFIKRIKEIKQFTKL